MKDYEQTISTLLAKIAEQEKIIQQQAYQSVKNVLTGIAATVQSPTVERFISIDNLKLCHLIEILRRFRSSG